VDIFEQKLNRIAQGERPRVLDLFAGCGGISLGFQSAGFDLVGAVEFDPAAAKSHAMNFHKNCNPDQFIAHAKARDITKTEPAELFADFGLTGNLVDQIDLIVGGPPCQAFARVGRAKLREVAEHPEAFLNDPRSNLYLRYLDYVGTLKPLAILMENVPDVLNFGGHNIAEEVCEVLEGWGYQVHYTLLNAVYYGVPEMRERMFLVAYRSDMKIKEWFPKPTNWIDLPQGYLNSRQVALKTVTGDLFAEDTHYMPPPQAHNKLIPAVTAIEALEDLPFIGDDSEQKIKKGARHFDTLQKYRQNKNLNNYQCLMRSWPNFTADSGIYDHVIRYLPRDYKIFREMKPGDQYPEAYQLALDMLNKKLLSIEKLEGKPLSKKTTRYKTLLAEYVPPYDPGKFPNKWRKMEPDKPARTLMAHLGKDSYSHIHYDSSQARTISVREAARLQSFPDGFKFHGPMNPAFKQIGNAVPPLMARMIAETIIKQLTGNALNESKTSAKKTECV
jgi:DNA (cytosine-5)-methyltransferase 1